MGKIIAGGVVLIFGVLFLLANYGFITWDVWKLWPVILILVGLAMIFGDKPGRRRERVVPA